MDPESNPNPEIVEILLVEDNPGDVRLTKESLKKSKMINNLNVVEDGGKALDFLHRRNGYEDAPRPQLILLDLNLPVKTGQQVLKEIKGDPQLKKIPVVILTTSEAEEDVVKSYELNANCYVTKPLGFNKFQKVVNQINDFWFGIVSLPEEEIR